MEKGEFPKGNTRAAKLTGEQVMNIRGRYARGGVTQGELCREYRVSINTIARIVNGQSWAGLPIPLSERELQASQARLAQKLGVGSAPEPTASELRAQLAEGSLEELLKREALKDAGEGTGLQRLHDTAHKELAPDRALDELCGPGKS